MRPTPVNDTFDTSADRRAALLNLRILLSVLAESVGIRLGDRLTGKPVHVDISYEPVKRGIITNRNQFILGPSGSGKSFFTNHMVRSYYEQGTHVVLVDVGSLLQDRAIWLADIISPIRNQSRSGFNPFHIGTARTLDTEKKESIKTLLTRALEERQ